MTGISQTARYLFREQTSKAEVAYPRCHASFLSSPEKLASRSAEPTTNAKCALETVTGGYSPFSTRNQRRRACYGTALWSTRRFHNRADLCSSQSRQDALRFVPLETENDYANVYETGASN